MDTEDPDADVQSGALLGLLLAFGAGLVIGSVAGSFFMTFLLT